MMYERKQYEPLDKEEWERRTKENIDACDIIAIRFDKPLLTIEERIQVGRMVGKIMQQEKEFRSGRSA